MKIKLLPLLLVLPFLVDAQYYPSGYFIPPMDTPLYLSAPFGSLRENHFHSGMDIRTQEKTGLPVYAVADGYVSRIKIQGGGYGKALYIDHPNGYTSVYGHLEKYAGEIAAYIRTYQYQQKQFEIDHFPGRDKLKVTKGQLIGYSGNSGTSTGPHLHFEIRDTRSEQIINPQWFGIPVMDTLRPVIRKVVIYDCSRPYPSVYQEVKLDPATGWLTDSGYVLKDTLNCPGGLFGLGIEAYDLLVTREKEYSVYALDYALDSRKRFRFALDRFPFDKTRSINAHIDYELYKNSGVRIQKLFLDDGNAAPLYPFMRSKGLLLLNDSSVHTLTLHAYDFSGSGYTCHLKIRKAPRAVVESAPPVCRDLRIYPKRNNRFQLPDARIEIPENALYDTADICFETLPECGLYANKFRVGRNTVPLNKSFGISIKPTANVPVELYQKLYLTIQEKENDWAGYSTAGILENGWISGRSTQFGIFSLGLDTLPPVVRKFTYQPSANADSSFIFWTIDDKQTGIQSYSGSINGKWILCEYDPKNNLLTYQLDDYAPRNTPVQVELILTDRKGNRSVFKKELTLQ